MTNFLKTLFAKKEKKEIAPMVEMPINSVEYFINNPIRFVLINPVSALFSIMNNKEANSIFNHLQDDVISLFLSETEETFSLCDIEKMKGNPLFDSFLIEKQNLEEEVKHQDLKNLSLDLSMPHLWLKNFLFKMLATISLREKTFSGEVNGIYIDNQLGFVEIQTAKVGRYPFNFRIDLGILDEEYLQIEEESISREKETIMAYLRESAGEHLLERNFNVEKLSNSVNGCNIVWANYNSRVDFVDFGFVMTFLSSILVSLDFLQKEQQKNYYH